MSDITDLQVEIEAFSRERDWDSFHNPKDLAIAIMCEAAELGEVFLWKKPEEARMAKIGEELADVLIYSLQMASKCGLDVREIVERKLATNAVKYPVDKSRGRSDKYTEL